jgi:hypothetical protein
VRETAVSKSPSATDNLASMPRGAVHRPAVFLPPPEEKKAHRRWLAPVGVYNVRLSTRRIA